MILVFSVWAVIAAYYIWVISIYEVGSASHVTYIFEILYNYPGHLKLKQTQSLKCILCYIYFTNSLPSSFLVSEFELIIPKIKIAILCEVKDW